MQKLQFLLIPLLIFFSCEGLADMIFSEAGEEEEGQDREVRLWIKKKQGNKSTKWDDDKYNSWRQIN